MKNLCIQGMATGFIRRHITCHYASRDDRCVHQSARISFFIQNPNYFMMYCLLYLNYVVE